MDVTSDEDTKEAASAVTKWLNDPAAKSPRILHAVVNNAGIGIGGLIDWNDISIYQKVMDGKCSCYNTYFILVSHNSTIILSYCFDVLSSELLWNNKDSEYSIQYISFPFSSTFLFIL